jgi:hypothetical protein
MRIQAEAEPAPDLLENRPFLASLTCLSYVLFFLEAITVDVLGSSFLSSDA